MTTSNWLTIVIALVSSAGMLVTGAVTWGGMKVKISANETALTALSLSIEKLSGVLVRLGACETALAALSRGHEKRGERLGVVEERVAAIEGSMGATAATAPQGRVRTRTRPVPIDVVASEESEGA